MAKRSDDGGSINFGPVVEPDIVIPSKERPEITATGFDLGIGQGDSAKIAAGLLFALDIEDQAAIIKKCVPGAEIKKDDKGKFLVQVGENIAYINKPGFSQMDFNQILFQVGMYVPAAKLATLGNSLLARMGIGSTAAAGTSVTGDLIANQFSDETGGRW